MYLWCCSKYFIHSHWYQSLIKFVPKTNSLQHLSRKLVNLFWVQTLWEIGTYASKVKISEDKPKATNFLMIFNQMLNSCSVIVTLSLYLKKWKYKYKHMFNWDLEFVSKVCNGRHAKGHQFSDDYQPNFQQLFSDCNLEFVPKEVYQKITQPKSQS